MATEEFTTDSEDKIAVGGIKYDGGKPCVHRGVMEYFPRALKAVAEISTFGASKYAWKGWEQVEDGINRYADASCRHQLEHAKGITYDHDSGKRHKAHQAWGVLAELELILREDELAWAEDAETGELVYVGAD